MKVLLDTHVFLWAILDDPRLSEVHAKEFLNSENELFLSTASFWESIIKSGLGKLPLPRPAAKFLLKEMQRNRVSMLPILSSHLIELETIPPVHRDPFDRMLVAQARSERMLLLSEDSAMKTYDVPLL